MIPGAFVPAVCLLPVVTVRLTPPEYGRVDELQLMRFAALRAKRNSLKALYPNRVPRKTL